MQFWTDFHEILMVGASPHTGVPYFFIFFIFWNNWSKRTSDVVENVPPQLVFWLSFSRYGGFWGKKFQSRIRYSISDRKGYIHVCCPTPHSLKNSYVPQKFFFIIILENIVFFRKNCYKKKYSKPHFLKKSLYWFLSPDTLFPSKWSCPLTNDFSQFFQPKLKNICKVFQFESILIWKKILRKINFVLIKSIIKSISHI